MAGSHVVNALGDGDRAVVTVPHGVDGRDVVETHWGWSVPGEWEETGLVRLLGKSDGGFETSRITLGPHENTICHSEVWRGEHI